MRGSLAIPGAGGLGSIHQGSRSGWLEKAASGAPGPCVAGPAQRDPTDGTDGERTDRGVVDIDIMGVPCLRRVLAVLLLAGLLTLQIGAGELDRVVEHRQQVQAELDRAVAAYEDLRGRLVQARDELASIEQRTATLRRQAAEVSRLMAVRARLAFQRGDGSLLSSVLSAEGVSGAVERAELLSAVTRRDRAQLEQATNLQVRLRQSRALLAEKRDELAALEEQFSDRTHELTHQLEQLQDREQDLRTRLARQRRIRRGVQDGTYACIMQRPYHFRDTWGAPRSGGRSHQGTDVMGLWKAEVYAFTNGRISRITRSGLGGLGVYLWGDDGNEYYYAHLHSTAAGVRVGMRVEAGQLIAYNGASGNAHQSAPHVHLELHPGGGRAVNPFEWLAAACF